MWATTIPPLAALVVNAGWAFPQTQVVESRVWPMARCPCGAARVASSNTWLTSHISRYTSMPQPSATAMPADSWPRCWGA